MIEGVSTSITAFVGYTAEGPVNEPRLYRKGQLPQIEAAARDAGLRLPAVLDFEHQSILENLQPLDFLALTRRYAEVQIQALQQEIAIYKSLSRDNPSWGQSINPKLETLLESARVMRQAVGP